MLDQDQITAASRTLQNHWRAGTKLGELDATLRPRDRAEGYAIQAALEHSSAAKLYGWKIAATSAPDKSTSMSMARWPDASWPRR
jgi:2-keto-4-pentenoate hydratase